LPAPVVGRTARAAASRMDALLSAGTKPASTKEQIGYMTVTESPDVLTTGPFPCLYLVEMRGLEPLTLTLPV
jgi:hypothetical protein